MALSPKAWAVLFLHCSLLVQSKDLSRQRFMQEYYLNPRREFGDYECGGLVKERALKPKADHLFIYISWYKVEHICVRGNWKDRYKNSYVWAQVPIKVLKCYWENLKNRYRETRNYNYVQFHCNVDGYVDSIEDMKVLEPTLY